MVLWIPEAVSPETADEKPLAYAFRVQKTGTEKCFKLNVTKDKNNYTMPYLGHSNGWTIWKVRWGWGWGEILRNAAWVFSSPWAYIFLARIRTNIFFINNLLKKFFFFNFSPFPLPLPPYHFSNGPITRRYIHVSFLPCHVLLHSCNHRRSNVKLNDTAVWKKIGIWEVVKMPLHDWH